MGKLDTVVAIQIPTSISLPAVTWQVLCLPCTNYTAFYRWIYFTPRPYRPSQLESLFGQSNVCVLFVVMSSHKVSYKNTQVQEQSPYLER